MSGLMGTPVVVFHDGDTAEAFIHSLTGWTVEVTVVDDNGFHTRRTLKVTGAGRTDDADSWLTLEGSSWRDDDDEVIHMDGDDVSLNWERIVRIEVF